MLLIFLLSFISSVLCEGIYELRIYDGAERGTRLTMGVELQRRFETMKNCFGQMETDIEWIEYQSSRNAFYTSADLPSTRPTGDLTGTLHLLCTGNRMHSLNFRVHVTHRNHHPPTFTKPEYRFYAPVTLPIGAQVGKMEVHDNDPVIYNSERSLTFTEDQPLLTVHSDGTLILKEDLASQVAFKPIKMQVLAIDYGSPQLFTIANLTVVPVTVSQVQNLRVNVATEDYQIFEWYAPSYGHPEKYRLTIARGESMHYEEELDGHRTVALTKVAISPSGNFTFKVSAVDANGETPSDWQRFTVFQNDITCEGECSSGGVPLCYYGAFNRLEQFTDARGAHCQCFHGYVGVGCDKTDNCQAEKTVDSYGGLDWREAPANATIQVPCPYNTESDKQKVERSCEWNKSLGRAVWGRQKEVEKCKSQASVLTHLGMLGTFALNANGVSTVHTVARFIRDLLTVPAFSSDPTATAHFDQKIAEQAALVIDSVSRIDFDLLQGNITVAKAEMFSIVSEFASRLPSPFTLVSPELGVHLKAMQWIKDAENFETVVGTKCRVKLPTAEKDHTVRSICMANASLFDIVDSQNPILSLKLDTSDHVYFSKMIIMLKPKDYLHNYTCVYYDSAEGGWSTRGIRRIDPNYHGFVRCETNHMGVFSLLPDAYFLSDEDAMRDLSVLLPTVTTFISMICSIFLLFMAAVQKNHTVDFALLVYLFFVFMIHVVHLVMLIAPQVGDPFALSPALHLILQFSVISVTATLYLVLHSIRAVLIAHERVKEEEEQCCSRPCSVIGLGIFLPAVLTFTTYIFSNDFDSNLSRVFDRIDWLFIANYLSPAVLFCALTVSYAVWNVYLGGMWKTRHRGSSERFLSLGPAVQASLVSVVMLAFLVSFIVLFLFRETSSALAILFSLAQIIYSCCAFLFAGYLFRMRYLFEREGDGSTQSLERKRDISRALLDHVDVAKTSENGSVKSADSGTYLRMPQNLYDHAPMVSIV
ncbi:unnamed protein product [Cylicocyclus nassatus]|uniref:GPS domain-containing protein n=1 Tax=Cylicocyclus nassatus TaxID=53992 RepID=A0AA36H051_CYLNA|nr:unnamed protein product [Cylicocyclus nassatus]